MRTAIVSVLVVVLGAGMALANPILADNIYIDFDPPNFQHRANPDMYTGFDAFVMVEVDFGYPGFTTVSFGLNVTPGMSSAPSFENLLPGNLAIGAYDTGITLASTECITPEMQPMAIAVLHCFYLGVPGDIEIIDHPEFARWIVLCDDSVVVYCVLEHGGVHKNPLGGDCGGNPVEDVSWGAIKALYR